MSYHSSKNVRFYDLTYSDVNVDPRKIPPVRAKNWQVLIFAKEGFSYLLPDIHSSEQDALQSAEEYFDTFPSVLEQDVAFFMAIPAIMGQ